MADDGRTEFQPEEAKAESERLSVPQQVQQDPQAPKITGYVLVSPIGKGAYAQVWKAWQVRTHKWVAVKVFIQKTGVNWLFLQREVERLIRLDKHPHIVSLLDADLNGEPPWYAMDYLEGGSLERFVDPKNPAPVEKAAQWMEEIAQALSYVHSKGLIHCDLKPANILLDEEGRIRVADFGQSRIVTESSSALGTVYYMAPEQAVIPTEGEPLQSDVRWDVYALGATLWAVLTGRAPHADEENSRRLAGAKSLDERLRVYRELVAAQPLPDCRGAAAGRIDEDLAAIVDRCAQARAQARYPALNAVSEDLAARRAHRPIATLAHRRSYLLRKWLERNIAGGVGVRNVFACLSIALFTMALVPQAPYRAARGGQDVLLATEDLAIAARALDRIPAVAATAAPLAQTRRALRSAQLRVGIMVDLLSYWTIFCDCILVGTGLVVLLVYASQLAFAASAGRLDLLLTLAPLFVLAGNAVLLLAGACRGVAPEPAFLAFVASLLLQRRRLGINPLGVLLATGCFLWGELSSRGSIFLNTDAVLGCTATIILTLGIPESPSNPFTLLLSSWKNRG